MVWYGHRNIRRDHDPEQHTARQHQFPSWEVSAAPGGRFQARLRQAPWITASGNDLAELREALSCCHDAGHIAESLVMLRHEVREYDDWQDRMNELRSRRISALEQALSARWPRRILLRARLARSIRNGICAWAGGHGTTSEKNTYSRNGQASTHPSPRRPRSRRAIPRHRAVTRPVTARPAQSDHEWPGYGAAVSHVRRGPEPAGGCYDKRMLTAAGILAGARGCDIVITA
jgi:hypothetical protein